MPAVTATDDPAPAPELPLGDPMIAVLQQLCLGPDPLGTLMGVAEGSALVRLLATGGVVVLVESDELRYPEERDHLAHVLQQTGMQRVAVLVVATEPGALDGLQALDDLVAPLRVDGVVLERGRGAIGGPGRDLPAALVAAAQRGLDGPAPADGRAVLRAALKLGQSAVSEHNGFVDRLRRRSAVVTKALSAVLVAVSAGQLALGAFDDGGTSVMVAMGALVPGWAAAEPWRLFSYALLHGGLVHLAMNTWVLWLIGGQLERLVGGGRMLALFTAGALGGGLAATTFGDGVTVGASGGIWALLATQGWLAWHPSGLLPASVVGIAKADARRNLMLNVLISLVPGVSFAGHLGGGLGGVLLCALGGVRGFDPDDDARVSLRDRGQSLRVALCAALLLGSLGLALAAGLAAAA